MTNCYIFLALFILVLAIDLSTAKKEKENETKHSKHSKKKVKHANGTEELEDIPDEQWVYENTTHVATRRILFSKKSEKGKRPYMVYLQLTKESAKAHKYRGWLCGGVIVDAHYVLTSAACVEDADKFYIVSGTTKFVDSFDYKDDECVCKNRRKVIWKCIPKFYKFDFQDSIKWSSNDIAIVKVDKPFKFGVVEKGCEFATSCIMYNNVSRELEKPGTKGFIAGWGSGNNFREGVYRRQKEVYIPKNAKCLQEAKVCIMDNEQCAKKWAQRFREIITQHMICTKDVMKRLSDVCDKRYANCSDVSSRRQTNELGSQTFNVDIGRHLQDPDDYTARRSSLQGGFCENDHGGPLIVKSQNKERVVGVISACKIDPKTHSCHGPFLYTSVYRSRQFISCAIHKDVEENCRRVFRSGITHEEWSVDWDGVNDGEGDEEAVNDAKENKQSESSSDSSDSTETLRQKTSSKEPETAVKKAKQETESESEETTTTAKPVEKKAKAKKPKSKKHKDKKVKTVPKPKPDPETYESSKDEAVNDPANE